MFLVVQGRELLTGFRRPYDLEAFDERHGITRTTLRILDPDPDRVAQCLALILSGILGYAKRLPHECAHFTGDTERGHAIGSIGRQFEREYLVVEELLRG